MMAFFGAGRGGAFLLLAMIGMGLVSALILTALGLVYCRTHRGSSTGRRRAAAMLCLLAGAAVLVGGAIFLAMSYGS